jgi:hypothetical protein
MAVSNNENMIPSSQSSPSASVSPSSQTWTVVASSGGLVLGQSPEHYAVYDQQNHYGAWPLTTEGYDYAVRSLAHGIAYTTTGYEDPTRLGLPTEAKVKSQTYASPLSYVGSTRRILAWVSKASKRSPAFTILTWTAAILAMLFMWVFLFFWYFVVFFLFGIFTFPYRFIRRSQRKNLHVQQTALATQQAMLQQMSIQQQQILRQQQGSYPQPPGAAPIASYPAAPAIPPAPPPPGFGGPVA